MEKLKVKIEESIDKVSLLENLAYYILLFTAFMIPLFFIPSTAFSFQFSKSIFISLAVIVSFVLWVIARLKDGRFILPNNLIFIASALVLIVVLFSTVLSPSVRTSFIGQGFEIDTWATLVVMLLLMFLFSTLFRPKERVFYLYLALFFSFFLIVLFHVLRFIIGGQFLAFGIFTSITSNLIGKWNDLGIFFALVSVLSMITLDLLALNKIFRFLVLVIFSFSVLSLVVVNYTTVWYALAFFSVIFYIYTFAFKKFLSEPVQSDNSLIVSEVPVQKKKNRMKMGSILAMIVFFVSIVFIIDNGITNKPLASFVAKRFNVSQLEVRPNWSSTFQVAGAALKKSPFFGAGPNRFNNQWLLNKPDGINQSAFWNTNFNYGIGLLPTFLVTNGILGVIVWLFLICALLYAGVKYLMQPITDKLARYLSVSSFFASVFLWVFFIFYVPSNVILALTFMFTGIFLASLYNEKLIKAKTISFTDEPKVSFVSVLVLTLVLVGVITLGYVFGLQFAASAYFQKALMTANGNGNITQAEVYVAKALSLRTNDLYDRFMVEVDLTKINNLLLQNQTNVSADAVRTQFQNILGDALKYAKAGTDFDATNYQNWVETGRVYESVVPLKIQGAYENASSSYAKALALNPKGPDVVLDMARLALTNNDITKAESYVNESLGMKNNYTEAIFLLSQIQAAQGKLKDAIVSAESASFLAPNDPTVFFQLGLLRYNNHDYSGAITALEKAVQLAPSYSNAKYFLGLSYQKVGKIQNALTQFNDIQVLNPGNLNVEAIISNLKAGRDPFANSQSSSPATIKDTLPVKEQSSGQGN